MGIVLMKHFTVLISSAGRRVALLRAFQEAVRPLSGRVIAADASPLSAAAHLADARFVVPRCTSPEFVDFMLDLCQREGVRLIVPTIDPELLVYAEHRDRFAAIGTRVLVSSKQVIEIGAKKDLTARWLTDNGLPAPRTCSIDQALDTLPLPFIVKPVAGSASIGVRTIRSPVELSAVTRDADYIAQEIASGDEYTVDVLLTQDGDFVDAVPRRRIEVRAGEVSKGITARVPELESLARDLAAKLPGAQGVINFQAFFEPAGRRAKIIEINPRFGGGYPLAHHAGANFARWLVEETAGLKPISPGTWREGVLMLRYDDAVFIETGGEAR